jgi:hypothetical protein
MRAPDVWDSAAFSSLRVFPILDVVDAGVVVSDDADAIKKVCDETGRSQQVCKSHVVRNTDALVAELSAIIGAGQDHSLDALGITSQQALDDLAALALNAFAEQARS